MGKPSGLKSCLGLDENNTVVRACMRVRTCHTTCSAHTEPVLGNCHNSMLTCTSQAGGVNVRKEWYGWTDSVRQLGV